MQPTKTIVTVLGTLGMILALAGCGSGGSSTTSKTAAPESSPAGDIPDDQAFVSYSLPGAGFSVKVPEGWSRTTDGDAVVFTDKLNTIRLETASAPTAPTVESVTSGELRAIERSSTHFKAGDVTAVERAEGGAIVARYQADSAPNSVTGKVIPVAVERYEFWKDGQSAVLTLSGPVGADNVDPWRIVTDSFAWTP